MLEDDNSLFPVPVRLLNFQSAGVYVNKLVNQISSNTGSDITNLFIDYTSNQLVRRFFIYDTLSGWSNDELLIVRFPTQIQLTITKVIGVNGQIYSPVLQILYQERFISNLDATDQGFYSNPLFSFAVVYQMDQSKFWQMVLIFFIIFAVIAGFAGLYAARQYSNRNLTPMENLGFKVDHLLNA